MPTIPFVSLTPIHKYRMDKKMQKFIQQGGELLTRKLPNGNTVRTISVPYKDGTKSYTQVINKHDFTIFDRSKTRTSRFFKRLDGNPIWALLFGGKVMK